MKRKFLVVFMLSCCMANPAVLYAQEQSVQHLKSKKNVTSLSDGSFHFETEDSLRKKKPRVAVGTNLLSWIGFRPDLSYTTYGGNVYAEYYWGKRYSLKGTFAYCEHSYKGGNRFQGFTSYVLAPRCGLQTDAVFTGFFVGVYGQIGDFHDRIPEANHTGHFHSEGVSAGYLQPVWKGLAVELNVRAGYRHSDVKKYVLNEKGDRCLCRKFKRDEFVLTGFCLNLLYRF